MDEYEELELGYPSEFEQIIDDYAEEHGTLDTVFGFVPKDIVEKVLEKHGGIDHLA